MKRIRNRQLHFSRALLTIVGLLLAAASVLGLLLATKAVSGFGDGVQSSQAVLNPHTDRFIRDHRLFLQLLGVAVAALAIVIGILWLRVQLPPRRHHEDHQLANSDRAHPGTNVVQGGALARAFENELERAQPIARARAEFLLNDDLVRLRLDIAEHARSSDVIRDVIDPAIDRVATVAELSIRPAVETDVRPVPAPSRRVS